MNKIIEQKLNETGSLLTQLRQVQEEKTKKYDGLLHDQEHKLAHAIADIEELRQKHVQLHSAFNNPGYGNGFISEKSDKLNKFLKDAKSGQQEIEVKDLRTDIDTEGGHAIQSDFSTKMIQRIYETSPIRQFANVEQTSTDHMEILVNTGEVGARWIAQGYAGSATPTPSFEKVRINVYKLEALPLSTTEAVQDPAIDLESWLLDKVSDKFARSENDAFVNGDGVNKPRGFLTYPNASGNDYEFGKIQQINSGVSGGVSVESLIDIQNSLKEVYQTKSRWFMPRSLFAELLKLKGSDDYYFLCFEQMGMDKPQMTILGKPVTFFADMPDPADGSLSIAYADMQQAYTILDRIGIQILRDPYTSKGNVVYYTTKRVGGDVVNFDAIKLLNLSS